MSKKNNLTTTKYVGQVKRYSFVPGRTKELRLYKFAEIGDDYLTDFELDISLDQIKEAHESKKPLTLYLSTGMGRKGAFGMGYEGKFYWVDRNLKERAKKISSPAKLIYFMFFISLALIGISFVMDAMRVSPLETMVPLFVGTILAILSGVVILGPVGDNARNLAPTLIAVQNEMERIAAEAKQDGFTMVKISS